MTNLFHALFSIFFRVAVPFNYFIRQPDFAYTPEPGFVNTEVGLAGVIWLSRYLWIVLFLMVINPWTVFLGEWEGDCVGVWVCGFGSVGVREPHTHIL